MMNSMWISLWYFICPFQVMSQDNHCLWQMYLRKALHWQTTYQRGPSRFGQGNYKKSMWSTQKILLNRNFLMSKVYMQNGLLLFQLGGPVLKSAKKIAPNAIIRVVSCLYILYDLTCSIWLKKSTHSLSYKAYHFFTVFFTSDWLVTH